MRAPLAIIAATLWISINEFLRNQLVLLDRWIEHFRALGMTFPGDPVNGAVWGLWSLCFAVTLFFLSRRYDLLATVALGWCFGFVLMWLVVGNLGVLPFGVLPVAVPWSFVEVLGAVWLLRRIAPTTPA